MDPGRTNTQSTQYNQIVNAYSKLYPAGGQTVTDYPMAIIEDHQLLLAVSDPSIDIRGKRVLDLASGNGYFANKFLSWGAASVIGVDISTAMLDAARKDAEARGVSQTKLKFHLGDVTEENLIIEGAPFDVVTGCWLLNYASDIATMKKMWKFIGSHLKPGGVWIGLTIPPLQTDKEEEGQMLAWAMSAEGAWGRHGNGGKLLERLPDGAGYKTRIELGTKAQDLIAAFDTYHPTMKVFEESCQQSEMFTGLEWRDFVIPDDVKKSRPPGFWNDLALWPHCRVCIARARK